MWRSVCSPGVKYVKVDRNCSYVCSGELQNCSRASVMAWSWSSTIEPLTKPGILSNLSTFRKKEMENKTEWEVKKNITLLSVLQFLHIHEGLCTVYNTNFISSIVCTFKHTPPDFCNLHTQVTYAHWIYLALISCSTRWQHCHCNNYIWLHWHVLVWALTKNKHGFTTNKTK